MQIQRNRLQICAVIFAAALAAVLSVGTGGAGAQSGQPGRDKIASDVKQRVAKGERVTVIIQSAGIWTNSLNNVVAGNGGSVTRSYVNLKDMKVASLPAAAVNALAQRSDVSYISLDREVKKLGHVTLTSGTDAARAMGGVVPYDGTGVGIAVLDSGLDRNHSAFTTESGSTTRIKKNVDFTGEGRTDDPYGHGTHVAGIAASNGQVSNGAYRGVAPNAGIINLRVLNSQGTGTVSGLLAAIDWIRSNRTTYNIRVVNMSLGTAALDSYKVDPLCRAVRGLVDLGVVVVAAAGNEGKDGQGNKIYGQIHSPGNEPSVITVGASNTYGTDWRSDDRMASYSSRGPTRSFLTDASGVRRYDNLVKPDLVAPGNRIISAQAAGNLLVTQNPSLDANVSGSASRRQMYMSGTSMATPVVAGASALLLQANPSLTPNLVKALLMYSAQQLAGFNAFEQGAGQVNVEGAMRLARLVRTDLSLSTPLGSSLLNGASPTPQTTISGHAFPWSQGIILNHTFATGSNLIARYQRIYALGVMLSDGTVESGGAMMSDGAMISDGVVLSDDILTSYGVMISDGLVFLSCGSLLSDGTLMSDGAMLSDGTLMSDGALMSDGTLMSDLTAQSAQALIQGESTASMTVTTDAGGTSATTKRK